MKKIITKKKKKTATSKLSDLKNWKDSRSKILKDINNVIVEIKLMKDNDKEKTLKETKRAGDTYYLHRTKDRSDG